MIELIRDDRSKAGTHGTFDLLGKTYHSLEPPDLGNLPFRSCVPQGDYVLLPYQSPKYGPTFIMVNPDLNVYQFEDSPGRPKAGRYLCLFTHKGNWPKNFVGCCGAGREYLDDQDMITATKTTSKEVNTAIVAEGSFRLRITHEVE